MRRAGKCKIQERPGGNEQDGGTASSGIRGSPLRRVELGAGVFDQQQQVQRVGR
jgi:hypothetical protein